MSVIAALIYAWTTAHGYGAPQRDAVIWNAMRESGLDPGKVSPDGQHIGLFQHNGPRRRALLRYEHWRVPELMKAGPQNIAVLWTERHDRARLTAQLEFMDRELRSMAFARRFFAATSATAARALMCREYERAAQC